MAFKEMASILTSENDYPDLLRLLRVNANVVRSSSSSHLSMMAQVFPTPIANTSSRPVHPITLLELGYDRSKEPNDSPNACQPVSNENKDGGEKDENCGAILRIPIQLASYVDEAQ